MFTSSRQFILSEHFIFTEEKQEVSKTIFAKCEFVLRSGILFNKSAASPSNV